MKTMKKLVAALLVLTMVLALTGTAMASCKLAVNSYVKFTKNGYAYSAPRASKKVSGPEIIVAKGSIAQVVAKKNGYVQLRLTPIIPNDPGTGNYQHTVDPEGYAWLYWFKASVLTDTTKNYTEVAVKFANGGVGKSKPVAGAVFTDEAAIAACKNHVKATAKVWMHKTYSLSNSYGKALHKDDKVAYRHLIGIDTRGIGFYGIKYKGKCLWVSSWYSKVVK